MNTKKTSIVPIESIGNACDPLSHGPVGLRTEYLIDPLGLDESKPRFSWRMRDPRRGASQTGFRVAVRTGDRVVWDSGQQTSDQSIHVEYQGTGLEPRTRYEWSVRIWDADGHSSDWNTAWFETGLMAGGAWNAPWIQPQRDDLGDCDPAVLDKVMSLPFKSADPKAGGGYCYPVAYLRTGFTLDKTVARARLYATVLGVYEFYCNGERVGEDVLAPGFTQYEKRVQYQTYDVTALLRPGANALGALLGNGWYCGTISGKEKFGPQARLSAQLLVDFVDGTSVAVNTDDTWKWSRGPIAFSDIYMGEKYDARLELDGWASPGYDDSAWGDTDVVKLSEIAVVAPVGPPLRRIREIKAVKITQPKPGVWVIDLGQNMAGWERLKVVGPAGTEITMRHGEMLNPDGTIFENLWHAAAVSICIKKTEAEESFEPHFTYFGFRYVQMTGFPGEPTLDTITGIVIHTDLPDTGSFECSEPLVNRLQQNIVWTQRANYHSVPTDCPQRSERLGWAGDAFIYARTGAFNMDISAYFTKWLRDMDDAQREDGLYSDCAPKMPGHVLRLSAPWADAGIICPWTIYLCYGDKRILEQRYERMRKYLDYRCAASDNLTYKGYSWGDWLNVARNLSGELIGTAFFAYIAGLFSKIATVLGKTGDALKYGQLAAKIRERFNEEFVTRTGRVLGDTQTAWVLALQFDLLAPEHRAGAVASLVGDIEAPHGNHTSCGLIGAAYINHVLTNNGRIDKAYQLLLQKTNNSWLYPVTQGATTIWERWDGWLHEKSWHRGKGFHHDHMNSFNHYAFGAIGEWLYQKVAGIDTDKQVPGYKRILIAPQPGGGLTYAKATYESIYGTIGSSWRRKGETLTLEVTIPPNTTATVFVPAAEGAPVTEGGVAAAEAPGVEALGWENGAAVYRVGSGSYRFASSLAEAGAPSKPQ